MTASTTATGTAVAGEELLGTGAFVAGPVTVGSTAVLLAAARPGRDKITLVNEGSTVVRIGPTSAVTTSGATEGGLLGANATLTLETEAAVYGIAASNQAVTVIETF